MPICSKVAKNCRYSNETVLTPFGPQIFWGSCPNFWTCIIKLTHVPVIWQSFTAIGQASLEIVWQNKKTSAVKHNAFWNCCSGRPNDWLSQHVAVPNYIVST